MVYTDNQMQDKIREMMIDLVSRKSPICQMVFAEADSMTS